MSLTIADPANDPLFSGSAHTRLRLADIKGRTVLVPPMGISEGSDDAISLLHSYGASVKK